MYLLVQLQKVILLDCKEILSKVSVAVHEYANSTSAHDTVLEHRFSPTRTYYHYYHIIIISSAVAVVLVLSLWRCDVECEWSVWMHAVFIVWNLLEDMAQLQPWTSLISIWLRGEGHSCRAESVLQNCVMGRCAICIFMYCYSKENIKNFHSMFQNLCIPHSLLNPQVLLSANYLQEKMEKFFNQVLSDECRPSTWGHLNEGQRQDRTRKELTLIAQ